MELLLILGVVALLLQVIIFVIGRKIRSRQKEDSVLEKYQIQSRSDLWKTLADPSLPDADRSKLEQFYEDK